LPQAVMISRVLKDVSICLSSDFDRQFGRQ